MGIKVSQNVEGLGSCSIRLWRSFMWGVESGGRYIEQIVVGLSRVTLQAMAWRGVIRGILLCRMLLLI